MPLDQHEILLWTMGKLIPHCSLNTLLMRLAMLNCRVNLFLIMIHLMLHLIIKGANFLSCRICCKEIWKFWWECGTVIRINNILRSITATAYMPQPEPYILCCHSIPLWCRNFLIACSIIDLRSYCSVDVLAKSNVRVHSPSVFSNVQITSIGFRSV